MENLGRWTYRIEQPTPTREEVPVAKTKTKNQTNVLKHAIGGKHREDQTQKAQIMGYTALASRDKQAQTSYNKHFKQLQIFPGKKFPSFTAKQTEPDANWLKIGNVKVKS